jgi:hypothetical protein
VDYRAFKQGFQASQKQSQSLYIALIKQAYISYSFKLKEFNKSEAK